jgi:hypothetical protein
LIRVAYLALLPAGPTTAEGRALTLRRAARIVRRAMLVRTLTGGEVGYPEWRRRVLRRVLSARPPRHHRRWLTITPEDPGTEAARLLDALGGLTSTQAVQYALRMDEDLSREETTTELDVVGVTVADDVVVKIEERTGLPEADQRALLAGRALDPTILHVRTTGLPRSIRIARHRSRLLAGALAMAVAAAGTVWLTAPSSPGEDDFVTHSTFEAESDVTDWPIRGNLRGDKKLMRRAVAYWNSPSQVGTVDPPDWNGYPTSTPTVVFAGDVLGKRVVVMADEHSIARYSEDPHQGRRIFVSAYGYDNLHPRGLIRLLGVPGERDAQIPYLVPPGVTRVLAAELAMTRPAWQPVPIHDGVATQWPTVRSGPDADCSMLMVALTRPFSDGAPRTDTYTDAGGTLITAPIDYTPVAETAAAPRLNAQDIGLLRAVQCFDPQISGGPYSTVDQLSGALLRVSIVPFWQGRLPETSARVAFATATLTTTTGRTQKLTERSLVAPDDSRYGGKTIPHAGPQHPLSGESDETYGAQWWKAPSGHWYLIVGGSADVARIRVWGQIDQRAKGNTFIFRGPKSKTAPSTVVTAVDKHGVPADLP